MTSAPRWSPGSASALTAAVLICGALAARG